MTYLSLSWNWELSAITSQPTEIDSIFISISRPMLAAPASLECVGRGHTPSADAANPSRSLTIPLYSLSYSTSGLSEQRQALYILCYPKPCYFSPVLDIIACDDVYGTAGHFDLYINTVPKMTYHIQNSIQGF